MRPQLITVLLTPLAICASFAQAQIDQSFVDRVGCVQCHGTENRTNGPSFEQIARRYQINDLDRTQLQDIILNGGKGNWTEITGGLTMPPYSNLLSRAEIDALVDWILTQGQ
ncbi:hypothetical protein GCM10008927_05410 [Amylibacter ulvae]|uniref:Cytochrome c domain-containing protein n=1 Tax=Paramylibacter ulvae TaxID=1651968 RepID=A0ABQ3CWB2_9RHOB|nr:c-type cytochrome [Amylibacter ulvae]GHA43609.1 hypothetical protein GCM10008927_05410 [Amylibacter ulvae]